MKTSENNLATKDMINLVGPSAVGKTSLINHIDSKYHNFGRVVSYTTRPKRQGEPEDTYRFIDPASVDLALLMDNSVQYDRFPDSDIIYGT